MQYNLKNPGSPTTTSTDTKPTSPPQHATIPLPQMNSATIDIPPPKINAARFSDIDIGDTSATSVSSSIQSMIDAIETEYTPSMNEDTSYHIISPTISMIFMLHPTSYYCRVQ